MKVSSLRNCDYYLDRVVLLDVGVGESNGSSIVGNNVWDLVSTHGLSLNLAELESSFFSVDFVGLESTLDIVKDSEELASLFNSDDVHHTKRELVISSNLSVDLDQSFLVLNDLDDLLSGDSISQSVLEEDTHGNAFSELVGSGVGSLGVNSTQFVQHPVTGSCQSL